MLSLVRTIAIADALGAPYEFADLEKRSTYSGEMGLGVYTDDTQMTIAIAEHMLMDGRKSQDSYSECFIEAYRRDPRLGYSKRTRSALESASPRIMLEKGIYGPKGNGSVMRCLPLGLYSDPKEVAGRALVQSTATHLSPDAAIASVLTALTAHYVYHLWVDKKGLLDFLVGEVGEAVVRHVLRDGYTDGEIGNDAVKTASWCIRTAVKCIEYAESASISGLDVSACDEACAIAMKIGGDVDSMCAVTCGIISLKSGYRYELGRHEAFMTDSEFGISYMSVLDKRLSEMFPRSAKKR